MNDNFVPQPSEERWRPDFRDQATFNDLPKDDIKPLRLAVKKTEHRFYTHQPRTARNIGKLESWIRAAVRRTTQKDKEHGFYIDYYGNVIGMIEGNKSSISFPSEYYRNLTNKMHTHPPINSTLVPMRPSVADMSKVVERYTSLDDINNTSTTILTGFSDSVISIFTLHLFKDESGSKLYLDGIDVSRLQIRSKLKEHASDFYNSSGVSMKYAYTSPLSKLEDVIQIEENLDNIEAMKDGSEPINKDLEQPLSVNITMSILRKS